MKTAVQGTFVLAKENTSHRILLFLIILVGVILRLELFLDNCSFNVDEASTAVDVCSRNLIQIVNHEFAYSDLPTRPIGLLMVYKLCVILFGNTEWVFRIFPLLCGIASIILFWKVVQYFVVPRGAFIALGLFVLAEHLIAYSASIKQYSCDTFVALLIYLMFIRLQRKAITLRETRLYGLLGVLAIFFSYTAVFLLTALGLTRIFFDPHGKRFSRENVWLVIYWGLGFVILYLKYFQYMTESQTIIISARPWFMPFSPQMFPWIANSFYHLMRDPLGLSAPALSLVLFVAGLWASFRKNKPEWFMLFLPILLVLFASGLKKYPFFERYILFIVPAGMILISQGVGILVEQKNKYFQVLGIIFIVILLFTPLKKAGAGFMTSCCESNSREIMQYFKENYQPNDDIYLNTNSQYLFWHYGNMLKINPLLFAQSYGDWYGQELFGRQVGKIEDYLWTDQHKNYIVISFEKIGYSKAGIFLNKFTDYDIKHAVFLYEDTVFSLPEQKRVWLLFLHSTSAMTDFAVRKFTTDAKVLKKIGDGSNIMYLLEKK